jgi:hypothetical protein
VLFSHQFEWQLGTRLAVEHLAGMRSLKYRSPVFTNPDEVEAD